MLENTIRVNLFLLQYTRTLVGDIADERMAEQPVAGVNHPAWILGHLAWTADNALAMLGAAKTLPAEWVPLFARESKPSASRGMYPSKDELLHALARSYEQVRQKVAAAAPEQLAAPTTNPRVKDALPTLKELIAMILTGHVGIHLGQLTSWRRMIGLPPMF
jgi:hypothetical protein